LYRAYAPSHVSSLFYPVAASYAVGRNAKDVPQINFAARDWTAGNLASLENDPYTEHRRA
jgi:hypothetical protein